MTNTKKWLAAVALLFVGYTIGEDAPATTPSDTLPISSISSTDASSVELDRVTQTPAHEPWGMNYTVEHNTAGGEGGWVMTEVGVTHGHECLIMVSLEPYRAIVVSDSSVMCEEAAVDGDADTPSSRSQLPGDSDDDLRGNTPKYTEMHGDTRGRVSAAPAPVGAPAAAEKPSAAPAKPVEPSVVPAAPVAPSSGLVNLNTASQSELEALPGVGEKTAQKIIAARPLASVGAVDSLPGVGSAMFGQIKDLVTV